MFAHINMRCIWMLALIIQHFAGYSQPYYFTHYQVEQGLSNNAVMCSMQDHHGFMWFGTRDGLNRYDGINFKVFRYNASNPKSIGSNAITSLSQGKDNVIWIGTEKGIYKYFEETETFEHVPVAATLSIRNLKVIGDDVWYISLYTLYRYNVKTGEKRSYSLNKEVTAYSLVNGELWVATSLGTVAHYNEQRNTFEETDLFVRSSKSVSRWIESMYATTSGSILVGTSNEGLKLFDIASRRYKDVLTYNPDNTAIIVREIIEKSPGEFWIASQSGIYILNTKTGDVVNLEREVNNPYSLSDNIVHTLCKDKEGGIWAGTYFGGLNYYTRQYVTFRKYFPSPVANSISGFAVREICNDSEGNLWIGTEDAGLNKLNTATGTFQHFNEENGRSNNKYVSYSNIHGLLVSDGKVWVGTYLHGLDVVDVRSGKRIAHYNTSNSNLGSNFIYSLYKTSKDQIIVATDKGLFRYDKRSNNFEMFTSVKKVFYRSVLEDRHGTLWAGTYGDGLFYIDANTGKAGQIAHDTGLRDGLPGNLINDIFEDSRGTLWIATEAGLCKMLDKRGKFITYTSAHGFPSDVIYSILEDDNNVLWISTSKGLVAFKPETKEVTVFSKAHGLLTDQFNYNSAYRDNTGNMYFGSVKGLIVFHPDSIHDDAFQPPVFLTGFQISNKELPIGGNESPLAKSISFTEEIELSNAQSSFSIDFAALTYAASNTVKYAYIMEGLDKTWTPLETNRKVYFTELDPGNYTFRVATINNKTGQYGKPATLHIVVHPPMWKTWWAYLLYSIVIAAISLLVIRHLIHRAREKTQAQLQKMEFEKEKEIYKDKIQFFTNVAHEIRTPLTLIQGPMENIMEKVDDMPFIKNSLEIMNKNTERLLHLSSQLLDFRKVEMNGFQLNFTQEDISIILREHYMQFKSAAEQKKIQFNAHCPESFLAYVDAEAFNKILVNLFDNTIKYAGSFAQVKLVPSTNADGYYKIIFENDGFIVPLEQRENIFKTFYRAKETSKLPGTGIGLPLSRSLAATHNGTLVMEKAIGINRFCLTLPVAPTSLQDLEHVKNGIHE